MGGDPPDRVRDCRDALGACVGGLKTRGIFFIKLSGPASGRISGGLKKHREKRLQVPVLPQPVHLGREIPVDNIALVVLETPRDYNQGISFPDPDALFYLPFDPSHPGDPVKTSHPYVVCSHHQIGGTKHPIIPFFWQPDPDERCTVGILSVSRPDFGTVAFFLGIIGDANNSTYINDVANN